MDFSFLSPVQDRLVDQLELSARSGYWEKTK